MSFVVFEIQTENQVEAYFVKRDDDFLETKAKNGHVIRSVHLELVADENLETSLPFLTFRDNSPVRDLRFEGMELKRYQHYQSEVIKLTEGQGLILTENEAGQFIKGELQVDCGVADAVVQEAIANALATETQRVKKSMHNLVTSLMKQKNYQPSDKEKKLIQDLLDD